MQLQDFSHRMEQRSLGKTGIGRSGVAPAVAGVNPVVAIEEEDREGEVVVEPEEIQVHAFHVDDANADELLRQLRHVRVLTDNLPVEVRASGSPLSAKLYQNRAPALAGDPPSLGMA